jgi:hypothetical protein
VHDHFRENANRCTVVIMWLAGIPVADKAVLHLAASLREAELVDTAERLERAYDGEARNVARDVPDREAILRVLEHLRGVPWARIGEHVGQRSLAVTAYTYSHVLVDEAEVDYATALRTSDRGASRSR